ncbi:MAG: cyanophycin synthetase, partial [Pseudomonadota bacterium]|nr:cyanophycin synthetase [Pseudomonadota bacterium]
QSFRGLPHRCQWVGEKDGVAFINDSKATNVGATLAALGGISGSVVLIAGGRAKGADFAPMVEIAREKLKGAVLIGESAEALCAVLADVCPTELAGGMDDAVSCAFSMASAGDTILFSPACASQDMFLDYQVRGDAFVREIQVLLS